VTLSWGYEKYAKDMKKEIKEFVACKYLWKEVSWNS
jgi:hypothetical protein